MKKILVMEDERDMNRLKPPPEPKHWKKSRLIRISVWRFSTSCCQI